MRLNLLTSVLAGVGVLVLLYYFRHEPWTPLRVTGAAVGLVGIGCLLLARYQLGRSFSITAQARELVTTGLYARIRNPIYVFGCMFFAGVAMFVPSWWPVLLLAITVPLQVKRARREAGVLQAAFGQQYERYRAQTWF